LKIDERALCAQAVVHITTSKNFPGEDRRALFALRIEYGSIPLNACFSPSDAPLWPPAQSMFYDEY
jgi:hypothetical protein